MIKRGSNMNRKSIDSKANLDMKIAVGVLYQKLRWRRQGDLTAIVATFAVKHHFLFTFSCQRSYTFGFIASSMYLILIFVDCSTHPLRIGYYASPECTSLHTLTDSDGLPNAQYARLNHPASYQSGSGTKYYEYVAGSYLTMKLAKQAQLYAIAVQGSPDNLRYFLRSFELSYKVTVNNLDVNKAAVTTTSYYKENGIIKVCCFLFKVTIAFVSL